MRGSAESEQTFETRNHLTIYEACQIWVISKCLWMLMLIKQVLKNAYAYFTLFLDEYLYNIIKIRKKRLREDTNTMQFQAIVRIAIR